MKPIKPHRKIKIILEHQAEAMFLVIEELEYGFMIIKISDINCNYSEQELQEIKHNSFKDSDYRKKMNVSMLPFEWVSEDKWVGDDESLNLSIFDLISYKPRKDINEYIKPNANG